MIKYQLGCACGHQFEAWFASSAAFAEQRSKDLLACPACASQKVDKLPMAPAIVGGGRKARKMPAADEQPAAPAPPADTQAKAFVDAVRQMRAHLEAKSENVGPAFAEEARRMHFGESEARSIHGEASLEDVKSLEDDGVPFGILPRLPEDQN